MIFCFLVYKNVGVRSSPQPTLAQLTALAVQVVIHGFALSQGIGVGEGFVVAVIAKGGLGLLAVSILWLDHFMQQVTGMVAVVRHLV